MLSTEACNTDTTSTQPHQNSNTHRTKNNMTNVVIQQNSRKLLMMDVLMSETCWAHKMWNKIASDIKLVFYSSIITMKHGPLNILLFMFSLMKQSTLLIEWEQNWAESDVCSSGTVRTADPTAMWSHPNSLEPVSQSHIRMGNFIRLKSLTSGL